MLRVELEANANAIPTGIGPEWLPTFCHGLAQGYTYQDEHRLSDGTSLLEIAPSKGILRGSLAALPLSELACGMLHVAFCLMLRGQGMFDAHAAVACFEEHALVLLGDAGAGKTTTLLSLLAAGATYLGDDRVLLREGSRDIQLLGYPRDFHVSPDTLRAHPRLRAHPALPTLDGKSRLDPGAAFPDRFQASFEGKITLLAPSVQPGTVTQLRPLAPAEALGRLLGASATVALEVLPARERQLALLTRLANTAPAYELRLGSDVLLEPGRAGTRLLELVRSGRD